MRFGPFCTLGAMAAIIWLATAAFPAAAGAQTEPAQPYNNFQRLFPNPTGTNGYEDFVRAGDLIENSRAWREYEQGSGGTDEQTLGAKRRALADPAVQRALAAFRAGLKKPVFSPRAQLDENTVLPELATFRALARLLMVEMYVDFADGRTGAAVDVLRDGLAFAYQVQTDTLINGLVAIAVDAIVLHEYEQHREQLDIGSCNRVIEIVREWLRMPDPAVRVLNAERKLNIQLLQKYRDKPQELIKLATAGNRNPPTEAETALTQLFQQNAGAAGPLFDRAAAQEGDLYDAALASLHQPIWQRAPLQLPPDTDPQVADVVSLMFSPTNFNQVLDRYSTEVARVQMLAVDAAIRRYRWEFSRLPGSLEELKLGGLIVDPFSGATFTYKRLDESRFELSSAGPLDRGTSDRPASGRRVPITMPYHPPAP